MGRLLRLGAAAVGLVPAGALAAMPAPGGSPFQDAAARSVWEAAAAARVRLDSALISYTAVVKERIGANLSMPLKDRNLYRAEAAHRVFWNRDEDVLVQVLALREETPTGVARGKVHLGLFDDNFDPGNDQLLFGMAPPDDEVFDEDRHDFWLAHPLDPRFRDGYRYSVGDTLVLSLPDGRRIQAVELRVVPAVADVHRISGSLWIEPETGDLVRAVYRLSETVDAFRDIPDLQEEEDDDLKHVPGILKPWTADVRMIAVDYARWGDGVWLPRSLHAEGVVRAGILKAPASVEVTYAFESVVTRQDLAREEAAAAPGERTVDSAEDAFAALAGESVGGEPYHLSTRMSHRGPRRREKRVRYLVPDDPDVLLTNAELPPPIWDPAPGFTSEGELRELFGGLADLPAAPRQSMPHTFRWGLQRPDLIRYNRVEGLSLGARGQIRPGSPVGPLSLTATARVGEADLEPNGRIDVTRETLRRAVTWSVYSELAAVDEDARHLGLGNSVTALLFGRDDGDYYRRAGTALEWTPPSADRRSFRVRAFAQYERAAEVNTDFALAHPRSTSWDFRRGLVADEGWETGAEVTVSPWWGADPRSAQGGVELTVRGADGDWRYARASLVARAALPMPGELRVGLEAGAGSAWGEPPAQRLWAVGGPASLRGYAPRAQVGTSYGRARAEIARTFSFGALSFFGDGAWAGDRDAVRLDDALASVGVGLSVVDGLIRLDLARGLRDPRRFRLDLYLDGIL